MKERKAANITIFIIMAIVSIAFILPVIIVAINSFKGQFFISDIIGFDVFDERSVHLNDVVN